MNAATVPLCDDCSQPIDEHKAAACPGALDAVDLAEFRAADLEVERDALRLTVSRQARRIECLESELATAVATIRAYAATRTAEKVEPANRDTGAFLGRALAMPGMGVRR